MTSVLVVMVSAVLLGWQLPVLRSGNQGSPLDFSCVTFPYQISDSVLRARFGAQQVTTAPVTGMDDGPTEGTVLFPQDPNARVEIGWRDPASKRIPALVSLKDTLSRWRTPNGITVGLDLRELERANGRPFRLAGFSTELQGRVLSWAGGRLAKAESGRCAIRVYLQHRYDGTEDAALVRATSRGREYSSGHPAMQALNPRVVRIMIAYP